MERRERLRKRNCCLACEGEFVDGEEIIRGVHRSCYNAMNYRVNKGEANWDSFVRLGELLEEKKRGRKPKGKFSQKLSERVANGT